MPLVLAGVLATDDPKQGMAIIGESAAGGQGRRRRPTGAGWRACCIRCTTIAPSSIAAACSNPCSCRAAPRRGDRRRAAARRRPRPTGNDAMLERMRKLVNDDPGVIGQVMRPQPVFAGGKMRGFRVYPGRQPPGLRAHGPARRRPGHGHQRHAAQRQGPCPGNLRHPQFLHRCAGHHNAQWPAAGTGAQHCADRGRSRAARRRRRWHDPDGAGAAEPSAGNE